MSVHSYPVCRLFSQTLNELHDTFTNNNNLSYRPFTLFLLLKAATLAAHRIPEPGAHDETRHVNDFLASQTIAGAMRIASGESNQPSCISS